MMRAPPHRGVPACAGKTPVILAQAETHPPSTSFPRKREPTPRIPRLPRLLHLPRLNRVGWAVLLALPLLSGCSTLGDYWQSVGGHLKMMHAARPVTELLDDPSTSARLKARLEIAQQIRRYAAQALHLPDNASYQRYADLHRPAVVWNVSAAPELSLKPVRWCFPVAGCVSYKGFFDEAEAHAEAARLRAQGLEVSIYPVPAYSTLGWLNWAGGDPLLSTFIDQPDAELARLIFHELAHQVVYAAGDTAFNESFATAVENLGMRRWLATEASPEARQRHALSQPRRQQFRALVRELRRDLQRAYGEADQAIDLQDRRGDTAAEAMQRTQRAAKAAAHARFAQRYAAFKAGWGGYAGFDNAVAGLNNASLGAGADYERWVPAFEALFEARGQDWPRFYAEVRRLASLPKPERDRQLTAITPLQPMPGASASTPRL